ncbi:MAG: glyoxalase [Flavobacteriales bacterium]|nr:MAG: glyoxalase [Flavobacteriales bacterium]
MTPFHLAIPVTNLSVCRKFYREVLKCEEGRSDKKWVDFNFFGHQLVLHEKPKSNSNTISNPVDGHEVPVPHFGVVLAWEQWELLAKRLVSRNIEFIIDPHIRFKGKVGEQATLFFKDPENNALEFKAFKDMEQLFKKNK